ncbi:hypothetical protein TNIN_323131 [Trichonephila inaurata madagascariensis]|uniref:Uncharacterized protein n=1 Tax=Trichonephila inaurata madagascariensis TaxID=2747483 RepID=A0A8X6YQY8_9ARAC|nr:hypothetical protein TNIN_323131 [Trichonephila inaurata madagascariensis]
MPDFNAFYESFFSDRRQEEEPMDWEDAPLLPEVSAPFVPSRPPRKMRSLISVQVSEPPSLSANRFPTMRALVPKIAAKKKNPWTGRTPLSSLRSPPRRGAHGLGELPLLPEVRAPFVPSHPPRKMRSLISVQISEPPSLSANRFPQHEGSRSEGKDTTGAQGVCDVYCF